MKGMELRDKYGLTGAQTIKKLGSRTKNQLVIDR
jgi:hypothetical protein